LRIAVDSLGGDDAPQVVLSGVTAALSRDVGLTVVLLGPKEVVEPFAATQPERVEAVATSQAISMGEHPAEAVRTKKDSSIVVGCKLIATGQADGFYSAGSTGAVMAAATLYMGRIKGIARPMLTTLLPTRTGRLVFGDVGANADVKLEYLLQFAQMGEAYARKVMGVTSPKVGLLNIGEEASKGSELAMQAHSLLSERLDCFAGNAEGTDLLTGRFDVIVTDGFTGNVVLKTVEGAASMLFGEIRQVMTAGLLSKLAAAVVKPGLLSLRQRLSADAIGGAPLLGVKGSCLIGHGSSSAEAIMNGILATAESARAGLSDAITEAVAS
jgi:glycerol-3-phosphate acyltransferase PlsX